MSNLKQITPEQFVGVQPTVFESSINDNIRQNRDPALLTHSRNVKEMLHHFSNDLQKAAASVINNDAEFTQKQVEDFWQQAAATIEQYENTQASIQNFLQQQKSYSDIGQERPQHSESNNYNVNAPDEWI